MATQKKKIIIITIAALILLVTAFAYPFGKKVRDMMYTRTRPVEYGKEVMYSYIEEGDISVADQIFENKYEVSRFQPVEINELKWNEDPFSDLYWRFNFYNLEPARSLLFAWEKNGNQKYKDKLIEMTESFIANGMNGPYSWDFHGTSFRTMTLINIREKLRQKNELPADLDKKIVDALKTHGDFLANTDHFEKDYNHGLDQAAALYLLAVNYPELPGADDWLRISSERMVGVLSGIIDDDGILVENSPYYHLYVLEKILDIDKYLKKNNLAIRGFSDEKVDKMVSYAVYMLQPDLNVPTIGASIRRQIGLSGIYKEIAASHPNLLYVLTQGAYGEKPSSLNVQYPVSGETIMRSGWGRGKDYENQTQLIFDAGNYRTNHSDLDALSFSLFSKGIALMPDAGLYSYESGPYRSYFHGTKSHNTVVVDGKNQSVGDTGTSAKVTSGFFQEGSGYAYQSGESNLYDGVSHERAVAMIEDSTILIIDNLRSSSDHTYEQMFHIFPGAKISSDGLTFSAQGDKPDQSLTIKQFITGGVELHATIGDKNTPNSLCSSEYNKAVPCYALSYAQKGKHVSYVTAVSIGKKKTEIKAEKDGETLNVKTDKGEYSIKIKEVMGTERKIEVNKKIDVSEIYSGAQSSRSLNMLNEWKKSDKNISGFNGGSVAVNGKENSLEIMTPSDGSIIDAVKNSNLDLSNKNIYFKIKIDKTSSLQGIDISLSNNNWKTDARYNIDEVFNYQYANRDGEWLHFGVGKSDLRKNEFGGWWIKSSPYFDWSKVDGVKITARSKQGQQSAINIKEFALAPDQEDARVAIVFDDGWSSVMDAAKGMNEYGIKGNVGVITGSVGKRNYLTLDNLKELQNSYGWNVANHSSLHKNAFSDYESNNNLQGLDNDVSDALQYLIQNDINSAPNWYIYPDGSTDGSIKKTISKYYKFGRATAGVTQVFPFAEPLEVGVFPVYSDRTTPVDVHNAISDAVKYNQTIFLMFHKISKEAPSMFTEISQNDFETILKDINEQGIKVVTLSEFDKENSIPETEFMLHNTVPGQIKLDISSDKMSNKFIYVILHIWEYLINSGKKLVQGLK
jgi:peptidoglycan/xylan/chitin deacetylase (PgdA/CDA1 family)